MRMEIYRYKFPLECYYAIKALRIKAEMENQLMARGRYVW